MKFPILVLIVFLGRSTLAQSDDAIAKIDSTRMKMEQLAMKDELAEVAGFYTADATVNGFDGSLNGLEEIRGYWKNFRGQGVDWEWKDIEYSGTDAYVTQTGVSLLTLRYGVREITYESVFSVVWERQDDGSYLIVSDLYRHIPVTDR